MYYVYILQDRHGKIYIGYSADLKKRLQDHLKGRSCYLRNKRPVKLIYYEAYLSRKDARAREKSLKNYGSVLAGLKLRIKNSFMIS